MFSKSDRQSGSFVGCVESSEHTIVGIAKWCVPKTPHTLRDSPLKTGERGPEVDPE